MWPLDGDPSQMLGYANILSAILKKKKIRYWMLFFYLSKICLNIRDTYTWNICIYPISTGLIYNIYQRTDMLLLYLIDRCIGIFKEATILTDNIETPDEKRWHLSKLQILEATGRGVSRLFSLGSVTWPASSRNTYCVHRDVNEKIQTAERCIDTNTGEKNSEDTRFTWCTLNQ